ncbi:carboxymuconolactone decarboxylase family protein [Vibrio mangrovi]|uniref:Carboxymuconolactone decarboxylase family protein n=1 Tax=Vibrio mangrovi TaxID=474394 RepID=A0A1Y6ISR5_9VIBR|nr:carboxymuconolactone decarboxylase family protein [Vibrio mangrovi]MDW6001295.1 carboxymuconolactone decarboxylase family protein [Vibrio mangrovi]SMS00685.1 Carboxymuconolactone decarboxylase family protein [Vibrio mangrovi]
MTHLTFDHIPRALLDCMMQTEKQIRTRQKIPEPLLGLIRYYASVLNRCAYCMDMHFKEGIAAGETTQRLYSIAVWRDTSYYTAEEQAVLAWTEAVTQLNCTEQQRQAYFTQLQTFFPVEDITWLTLAITQINTWNRLMKSFGIEAGNYQAGAH